MNFQFWYFKYFIINTIYHSKFIISDSGTGQEEPALFNTKVLVPRDFSERPQSYEGNCSFKFRVEDKNYDECFEWIEKDIKMDLEWLGKGNTVGLIIKHLKDIL